MEGLECLGTVTGNCVMVDGLRNSIKYTSQTRALLRKGEKTIDVFTWPGAQAGYVAEPLSGALSKLLTGPVGTVSKELHDFLNRPNNHQENTKTSYPIVMMDARLVASPTPTPNLTIVIMIFSRSDHSAMILQTFEERNLKIEEVNGYCAQKFGGVPHSSHHNDERSREVAATILGCKTRLLPHQQEGLRFILDLESPALTILAKFWNSATCEWLRNSYHQFVENGNTRRPINHHAQGSILADDMGLGKTLTSLALIVSSKNAAEAFANTTEKLAKATLVICPLSTLANWEAEIHKHLDLNITKYAIYRGEARKKLTGRMLWDHDLVIATYDTVSNEYESDGGALFEGTWFRTILDEAQ